MTDDDTPSGRRGPKPKPGALRRARSMEFTPGPDVEAMLEKLATTRANGNKTALLRQLIRDAFAHDGEGTTPGQKMWLVRRGGRSRRGAPIPQPAMRRAA
jgi:hypothetical protein